MKSASEELVTFIKTNNMGKAVGLPKMETNGTCCVPMEQEV